MTSDQRGFDAARLLRAERQGLRLAILCRTLAISAAFAWFVLAMRAQGFQPNPWTVPTVLAFVLFGLVVLAVTGTRFDRPWLKYALFAADLIGVCALFALLPLLRGAEVPQILVFRAYGIYYLFPLVALATLALSWRLVLWAGAVAVIGWWGAFVAVSSGMDRHLSWQDLPPDADGTTFQALLLAPDFVGIGNRIEETGTLLVAALILAVAVFRARRVFLAQVHAEAEREVERRARARIGATFGRFVPEAVAARLMADDGALQPQVRDAAVLVTDVQGFTAFAAGRPPEAVIETLNAFLARAADAVADHEGVVVSFTGDGLLATFNTPLPVPRPEAAALAAARDLVRVAAAEGLAVRVGLAAGPVAAGSVGSARRQAFTVYGDTVNRAARLEALAKELGETILADETIATGADAGLEPLGHYHLRGFPLPIRVWRADGPTAADARRGLRAFGESRLV